MKKNYKKLKKLADEKLAQKQVVFDENDRVVLSMHVKNDDGFLSEFSSKNTPVISSSVAEFLEESAYGVPLKNGITLNIESNCIDENEKIEYEKAIREYYSEKYVSNEKELKKHHAISYFLIVLGVFILALAIYFNVKFGFLICSEIMDIVAWVFLWEATDILCFKSKELRDKRKKYLAFLSMEINFVN